MLVTGQFPSNEIVPLGNHRQRTVFVLFLILAFHVQNGITVKFHRIAGGFEQIPTGGDIHLAGLLLLIRH